MKNPQENIEDLIVAFISEVYEPAKYGGKTKICECLGVSMVAVCHWKNGDRMPSLYFLNKMWEMVMEVRNDK